MSYYDADPKTREGKIGKRIYMEALRGRRGFRDDQLGIEDPEIWDEIFEQIGRVAIAAVSD
jgi:hypothetical protein